MCLTVIVDRLLLASNDTAEAYAALQAGVLELCGAQLLQSDSVAVLKAAALLVHALASQHDQAVRALTHSVLTPPNTVIPAHCPDTCANNTGGHVEVTVLEAVLLALGSLCGGTNGLAVEFDERAGTTQMQRTMSQMFASDVSAISLSRPRRRHPRVFEGSVTRDIGRRTALDRGAVSRGHASTHCSMLALFVQSWL